MRLFARMENMNRSYVLKVQNEIEESIDRHGSILGIPKKEHLLKDIVNILQFVREKNEVNNSELTEFIMEFFGVSFNTARSVRTVLERANLLLRATNKKIRLTNMAENYFKTNNYGYLKKRFVWNFFGFFELLLLVQIHKPKKKNEILSHWEELYQTEFGERKKRTYSTQFDRVFIYLRGLGLIKSDDNQISINYEAYDELENVDFW